MTIYELARQYRNELLAADNDARARIRRAYLSILPRLRSELTAIQNLISDAEKSGAKVSLAWLFRQERYQFALLQVEAEIQRFSDDANVIVLSAKRTANGMAVGHAGGYAANLAQIDASFFGFLPSVVETNLGLMANGSPILDVFGRFGRFASSVFERELSVGIIQGKNPRDVARTILKTVDAVRWEAEWITRTEILRAYRETSAANFQKMGVDGWLWLSGLGTRTCAVCWAMHGTFHPNTEVLSSHPNCRCSMVPVVRDMEPMPAGADLFRKLDDEKQREILGRTKYNAYKEGRLQLNQLVRKSDDPKWGIVRHERSAKSLGL